MAYFDTVMWRFKQDNNIVIVPFAKISSVRYSETSEELYLRHEGTETLCAKVTTALFVSFCDRYEDFLRKQVK